MRAALSVGFGFFCLMGAHAIAGEGGSSNYLPGGSGDFGIAIPDEPGVTLTAVGLYLDVSDTITDTTTGFPVTVTAKAQVIVLGLDWTSQPFWDGIAFSAGVAVPAFRSNVSATVDFGVFGTATAEETTTGIGDIIFNPITLWGGIGDMDTQRLYWSLAEFITAPTGQARRGRIAEPGRNHWSFDTVASVSWVDFQSGYELSGAAGVIFNTRNNQTDYTSGAEAHLDLNANMLVGDGFAVGITGYGVQQLERYSGPGAGADPLKGYAWGAGLQTLWTPNPETFTPSVRLKWLHDIQSRDRLAGDTIILSLDVPLN